MCKGSNLEKLELSCTAKHIFMLIGHLDILLYEEAFQVFRVFFFNGLWIFPLLICISHLQILILSPLQTSHTVASTHYVVFLKNFCFEIIMDLEKQFVKTVQEFPYTLHPHSSNVN